MKLCNNEGGYTRPLHGDRRAKQLGALEVRMGLEQLRGHGCLSAYTCVCPLIHLSASHQKQIVCGEM